MLDLLEKVQGKKNYFFTGIPSASDKYNTFFFKKSFIFYVSVHLQEEGYCCVQYEVCQDTIAILPGRFTMIKQFKKK